MTDQHPWEERELELATSQQLPASNGIDPAIKSARKDWLAIGAAATDLGRTGLNEQALLASLQNQLIKTTVSKPEATGPRSFDWSWLAVGLAAVVLIGATIVGAISQRPAPIPGLPGSNQLVRPPAPVPVEGPLVVQTPRTESNNDTTTLSWDDLDEEINTTYTALQQMTNERRGVDQTLTDFDTQLKQLSADIAGESL